ncbi:MAG: tetratricopeptide repeat protein [Methylophilaceae bacterium]
MIHQQQNSIRKQKPNSAQKEKHNASECFSKAIHAHQAGQWQTAESHYLELIQHNPAHLDGITLLGTLYLQLGHHELALRWLSQSISINPNQASTLNNVGNILRALNRHDEALNSYSRAISVNPDYADAYCNRANHLRDLQQLEAALSDCDRAITLKIDYADAYINRANILHDLTRYKEALADADKAILLNAKLPVAHNIRGNILLAQEQYSQALTSYEHAITLNPQYADAHNNLANALRQLHRYDEMLESYAHAIAIKSDFVDAYLNRGIALECLEQHHLALEDYDRAIQIDPYHPGAHWNKAQLKLLKGDWSEGWPLYEWRWKYAKDVLVDPYPADKRWHTGIPLHGKTILLHTEQGLGDTIQFCRYIPLLVEQGTNVVLNTSSLLKELINTLPCKLHLVTEHDALPNYDYHYPLMSLPLAFNTTITNVPCSIPYLSSSSDKQRYWQERLSGITKPKIGLIWNGNSIHPNDRNRSTALENIAALLEQDYSFHCLQKDIRPSDRAVMEYYPQLQLAELNDLSDTAALIEQLDIVISVCTSVAHLAGALGKPVWIMLAKNADWRWLENRTDSPWYPSVRLFRQPSAGNWKEVIDQIIKALETEFPKEKHQYAQLSTQR